MVIWKNNIKNGWLSNKFVDLDTVAIHTEYGVSIVRLHFSLTGTTSGLFCTGTVDCRGNLIMSSATKATENEDVQEENNMEDSVKVTHFGLHPTSDATCASIA